jgi:phosphopantothenoylcysteine decarboxylase / phosphopantothenate---cysteine ligase
MFQGKKILIGITGSIAAYKAILLVRAFVKAGAEVKVIVTSAAKDFVSPLTLATLSKNPVLSDIFEGDTWSNHVMLGRWADVFLIAPLSCNSVAKMAHGICDNLLMAVYLSATCPVAVAPAMDEDMWQHSATKANINSIRSHGVKIIPVEKGELASGLYGEGRMAETDTILEFISQLLLAKQDLTGKKALVSAGPTYEPLDPVRFIGNHSSGKMGIALAEELRLRGAEVLLVLGPSSHSVSEAAIKLIRVSTAAQMYDACINAFPAADIAIMSAAVADYTPVNPALEKIKKQGENLTIELKKTRDILKQLGSQKKPGQVLVGFALETTNEASNAISKLEEKNADMIVLNSLNDAGAGFGLDTNKITIFKKGGGQMEFDQKSKQQVAKDIVDSIVNLLYA